MKKQWMGLFLLVALLMTCFTALAGHMLPEGISAFLAGPGFEGCKVLSWVQLQGHGKDDCCFVLLRNTQGTNILHQFKQVDGVWKTQFCTDDAVPQTEHAVYLTLAESGREWPTDDPFTRPQLSVQQLDETGEYPELCITFELQGGKWLLHRVWSYLDYDSMLITAEGISYYTELESSRIAGTAKGTIQRDLEYFTLRNLPKTLKAARAKLTEAPDLPASAELTAQEIKFTGGLNYAVYSAPDKKSLRGGNGKAKVSTNGWIQVFGQEDDWILIQYSIDSGHYRFGYIPAKALPKQAEVPQLDFHQTKAYLQYTTVVTDDPLYSYTPLETLQDGTEVTWLATLGENAYIECSEGGYFRGFVPVSSLSTEKPAHDFARYTNEKGEAFDLFTITKMHYGADHRVTAVTGSYERMVLGDDCYEPDSAPESETTYRLAPDFEAWMVRSMTGDIDDYVAVTDLYQWYIDAYIGREDYDGHELVFACDLPEDDSLWDTSYADFWFVTTKIELNEQGEIQYMEYAYVPWG